MAQIPKFISIDGNIGSGKSTLLKKLKEHFIHNKDVCFLPEPVSIWETITDLNGESIISKYYKNQDKYSFSFQMMAYISRLSILKKALTKNYKVIISERSLYTDFNIFSKMLYDNKKIEEVEYKIYTKWFNEFIDDIPSTHIIYIKCSPKIAYNRVIKRNREGENIPIEYLMLCDTYHNKWLDTGEDVIYLYNKKTIPKDHILILNGDKERNFTNDHFDEWIHEINCFIYKFPYVEDLDTSILFHIPMYPRFIGLNNNYNKYLNNVEENEEDDYEICDVKIKNNNSESLTSKLKKLLLL